MSDQGAILIVDDTLANLRLLSQMLIQHRYKVRAVSSGARALASIKANPPELILLDIIMPEMTGYEVCEQLKQNEQTRDIPIIFISALDATKDKVSAFTAGGVDYVTKPFHIEEVLARVDTHLSLCRLQRSLQEAVKKQEKLIAELDAANTRLQQEIAERQKAEKLLQAQRDLGASMGWFNG